MGQPPPPLHLEVSNATQMVPQKKDTNTRGVDGVIKSYKGDQDMGFMGKIPHEDPTLVELHALKLGLKLAYEQNPSPIEINLDSEEVIDMLAQDNPLYAEHYF